ncbi:MAG: sigma-70 family RNA polymerase sigma factor [Planctomycetes bacterium]|nr:sigma-70 family RNA polymerase sigma factor [Planctomycetota bacterium]
MGHPVSESELLRASLAGSKEAFGAVVQRYQALVCAIAYSATGDIGASEELAQETFLRVWKNLRQLEDLGHFRAWLCAILRHLISQSLRERPTDVIRTADSLERAEAVTAMTPDPGQAVLDKERQELVWAAVRRVPLKYREPLVLFYRQGQSVRQVAADLGLSEEMVRQRLHRGRQYVKAEIAAFVEDTLVRSGPGKAFAVAVVAALPVLITPTASAAVAGLAAEGTPAAKTVLAAGISGVILGPILGLLGGILGAWYGVRNTKSNRERSFMLRLLVLVCVLLAILVALPLTLTLVGLIPRWTYWSCLGVYLILLVSLMFWSNARQKRIQIEEGTSHSPGEGLAYIPRPGVRTSFVGPIFGGTLWLLIVTGMTQDWMSFGVIVGGDVLLSLVAAMFYARHPERYWSIALLMECALMAMTLAAVNLRWTAWMQAYRRSTTYDPGNDVGLRTLNLILAVLLIALVALGATQYARHRATRKGPSL